MSSFDSFRELASRIGAEEMPSPPVIKREILERFDYFDSFPDRAVPVERSDDFYPPALCYFLYDRLRGARLEQPRIVTMVGRCARNEHQLRPPFRLRHFSMREIIFLGPRAEVERIRQRLIRRTITLAAEWELAVTIEPATDPFFMGAARGRELIQRLKGLKYELVAECEGERVALASFNHHEDFFGRRMEIRLPDGSFAHSGCVAFGLERWAAALSHRAVMEVAADAS